MTPNRGLRKTESDGAKEVERTEELAFDLGGTI
jgi:hypothetical protein